MTNGSAARIHVPAFLKPPSLSHPAHRDREHDHRRHPGTAQYAGLTLPVIPHFHRYSHKGIPEAVDRRRSFPILQ